jgi:hypothetical protein
MICKAHYLSTELRRLDAETIVKYEEVCDKFLKCKTKETVDVSLNQDAMFERLKQEKAEFVKSRFSKAVNTVIKIAFSNNINKITKSNHAKIKETLGKQGRCMNVLCHGMLDSGFKCILCDVEFCSDCEKPIDGKHVCSKEDLESIAFVSGLVKCPQCRAPVVRSFGCDNMTCAVCRINFDYVTGKRCVAGNHTTDAKLILKTPTSLMDLYGGGSCAFDDLLKEIDSMRPAEQAFAKIERMIKSAVQDKTKLCNEYSKHVKSKYQHKRFQSCVSKIEHLYNNKEVTCESLQSILRFLHATKNSVQLKAKTSKKLVERTCTRE